MNSQPRYPIYVLSKGRWERRLRPTTTYLDRMNVPFRVIVESEEADAYAEGVGRDRLLILDPAYQRDYETCDDLGSSKSKGPGPARNFAWDHAISEGHERHWIVDDNIAGFYRFHHNKKTLAMTGAIFRAMEDFTDRYENIAMSGPHYEHFVLRHTTHPPFILNSRIYSCNLIRNDAPFRWRGRYNEDTILSLDMLKAGWCTVLFVAMLQNKVATQRFGGGNTAEFYAAEGTLPKSRMLVEQHPDVSRLVWKWNRWHHHVDYRRFKRNRLILKPGVVIPDEPNEYGMKLVRLDGARGAMAAD